MYPPAGVLAALLPQQLVAVKRYITVITICIPLLLMVQLLDDIAIRAPQVIVRAF